MDASEIKTLLTELDAELRSRGVKGELCLYGGAVMCLVYQARPATKDVDAIFEPAEVIRACAGEVARRHHLREDWLNDAVKGFVVQHGRRILFDLENLKVFVPDPAYLLAMKCLAARVDTSDRADVELLIRNMGLNSAEQVFDLLKSY